MPACPVPLGPGTADARRENDIRAAIRKKYSAVAASAAGMFQYPVGSKGASGLAYDPVFIAAAGREFLDSFCGVGNPFSLGAIRQGDTVLDIGCGAGFDLFVAAKHAGTSGRVCGIDLTEEMVRRAEENLFRAGIKNFEVKKVDSEIIPYENDTFDVVISNGVINLSPDKAASFREIKRVLKPGGRFQFADVVTEKELPENMAGSLEAWSQ